LTLTWGLRRRWRGVVRERPWTGTDAKHGNRVGCWDFRVRDLGVGPFLAHLSVEVCQGVTVLSIGLMGHAQGAADYYVARQAGCALDYYTGVGERRGTWTRPGAALLGLHGELDSDGETVLRGLLAGIGPDRERLVTAVYRSDPRGRVPAAPLVSAVRAAAATAGLVPGVFLDQSAAAEFSRAERALTRPSGGGAGVRADAAVRVATAAGLDAHAVYATSAPQSPDLLAAALRHVGQRVDARRAGLDLTFSAPKSVSLLFAFGEPAIVEAVRTAHEVAIGESLAYLDNVAGHGLRGHQGDGKRAKRIGTDGLVAVAFEHRSSRAMDPQLHTHVVVPNLIHGADGQWSAVDTRALHRHARTTGYLYQAVLRHQLTTTLGVEWQPVRRGQADLAGIPVDAVALFSTRRAQIETHLDATGTTGSQAAQIACLATRPDKPPLPSSDDPEGLRERWSSQARKAGIDPDRLMFDVLQTHPQRNGASSTEAPNLAAHLLGPKGLTEHTTSFDRADLLRALCEQLPAGTPVSHDHLQFLADEVLANPAAVPLGDDDSSQAVAISFSSRWTTQDLLTVEAQALTLADELRSTRDPGADSALVGQCLENASLTGEQDNMVRSLTSPMGRLRIVVGPAGSGKTAALAIAHRAWHAQGRSVHGCALSALAARGLQTATGIASTSVAALLNELDSGRTRVEPGTVLIVDEAAMVGTRAMRRLLEHATQRSMALVLVGDPTQLPEIGAGGLFTRLAEDPATTVLTANQRQRSAWEQRALSRLRDGNVTAALDTYLDHQRIHVSPDYEHLQNRVADDYLASLDRSEHSGAARGVLVITATRRHAAQINGAIRDRLTARGTIDGPELLCRLGDDPLSLRRGDLVMVVANDHNRGLLNGEQGHITTVDAERGELVLATTDNRELTVNARWAAAHLGHGYALTAHKAQGQTVGMTLVAGSAALTRETSYTALSRGSASNHLYLAPDMAIDPADDAAQAWITDHALTDASQRLHTSRRQSLATDQNPRGHHERPATPTGPVIST
jgi:conjugative relaxase-like TrwC/TraI family protein